MTTLRIKRYVVPKSVKLLFVRNLENSGLYGIKINDITITSNHDVTVILLMHEELR